MVYLQSNWQSIAVFLAAVLFLIFIRSKIPAVGQYITGLLYDDGKPSRAGFYGGLLVMAPLLLWVIITGYLSFTGKVFQYYAEFAAGAWFCITTGCTLLGFHLYFAPGQLPGGKP